MITIAEPDVRYESRAVTEAIIRGDLSTGPYHRYVTRRLAEDHQQNACVLTANGTRALVVALRAAMANDKQEVGYCLVPVMAWQAVYHAVKEVGLVPLFADIDEDTTGLNWSSTPLSMAKYAILVHQYGLPARLPPDSQYWKGVLIEDCAEAPYAEINGRKVGSWGDYATWSFYANKVLTCGEGGAVVGPSDALLQDSAGYTGRAYTGYNERLSELQAAFLHTQLQRRKEIFESRQRVWDWYREHLPDECLFPKLPWQWTSPWLFPVKLMDGCDRKRVEDHFTREQIHYRRFFKPAIMDTFRYPVACDLYDRGLMLPVHHKLYAAQLEKISDVFWSVV